MGRISIPGHEYNGPARLEIRCGWSWDFFDCDEPAAFMTVEEDGRYTKASPPRYLCEFHRNKIIGPWLKVRPLVVTKGEA